MKNLFGFDSSYFSNLRAHAKFQNHRTTNNRRKVTGSERLIDMELGKFILLARSTANGALSQAPLYNFPQNSPMKANSECKVCSKVSNKKEFVNHLISPSLRDNS